MHQNLKGNIFLYDNKNEYLSISVFQDHEFKVISLSKSTAIFMNNGLLTSDRDNDGIRTSDIENIIDCLINTLHDQYRR